MRYVLSVDVPFEIATVRYGRGTGTDAVRMTRDEIGRRMPGKGPRAESPVTGRHGGTFTTFGDYPVNLFEHITPDGTPPSRALFDMAAAAILKNPAWARREEIPAPGSSASTTRRARTIRDASPSGRTSTVMPSSRTSSRRWTIRRWSRLER